MTHHRMSIATIAVLLGAIATGCGGGGLDDANSAGCIEVADQDGIHVECVGADTEQNGAEAAPAKKQQPFLATCSAPPTGKCVPIVLTK